MQPQDAVPTSQSPNPKYDFILKDQPKPKGSFKIPTFGLPRIAAVSVAAVLALFVIIILYSVLFANKTSNTDQLVRAAARAQEIVRVTKVAEPLARNPDTQELIATTEASLSSQEVQLVSYLKHLKVKVAAKDLSIYLSKGSDTQIQSAAQSDSLDSAYASYLKQNLNDYKNHLQLAAKGAPPKRLKLLNEAYQSTNVLLSAPQLANAGS